MTCNVSCVEICTFILYRKQNVRKRKKLCNLTMFAEFMWNIIFVAEEKTINYNVLIKYSSYQSVALIALLFFLSLWKCSKTKKTGQDFLVKSYQYLSFGNWNKQDMYINNVINPSQPHITNIVIVENNIICCTVHKSKCSTVICLFEIDAYMYLWTTTCVFGWGRTRALFPFHWVQNNQIRTLCMQYSSSCLGLLPRVKLKRKRIFCRIYIKAMFKE